MRIRALALICSFSVILSTVLAGCGGGGGGEGGGSAPPGATSDTPPPTSSEDTSDATTRQTLQSTNLDVGPAGSSALGTLKRWNLLVPVKNNDPRATQAMDMIEKRLGTTIFDRTSIANTPDDSITRGLIISVGTGPQSSLCGTAETPDGASAEMTGRLFIRIDSTGCTASLDATIHQFGHTLGVFRHFQNFGDPGNPTGELFWRVLRTIYLNAIGTPGPNIVLAPQ